MSFIFPSHLIELFVKNLSSELYGLSWSPHVVCQQKQYSFSEMGDIDYAVPCFELSTKLGKSPDIVTRELTKYAEDDPRDHFNEIGDYFKLEALNGYLNFQLTESYLTESLANSSKWFAKPNSLGQKLSPPLCLVIYANELAGKEFDAEAYAVYYASELWNLFDISPEITSVISNNSEKVATKLTSLVVDAQVQESSSIYGSTYMNANRGVRAYLSGDDSHNLSDEVKDGHSQYTNELSSIILPGDILKQTLKESDLVKRVDSFLNSLKDSETKVEHLVIDEASKATYVVSGEQAVALRSSTGFIFSDGYLAYVVNEILRKSLSTNSPVILYAPQRVHPYLRLIVDFVSSRNSFSSPVVYFDPKVSRASISEFQQSYEFRGDFNDISFAFRELSDPNILKEMTRLEKVEFISLPTELIQYLKANQLPRIFDVIGQVASTLVRVRSKTEVNVTAD
jgi:hypothetical protein